MNFDNFLKIFAFFLILILEAGSEPRRGRQYTTVKDEMSKTEVESSRTGKLSLFQVVRFQNGPCVGATRNGTCYTERECSVKGGNSDGTCANGFGVCCTFSKSCGQTSSENCTYFDSSASLIEGEECSLEICPCGDHICQLRLDFENFVITGPSTSTDILGNTLFGIPVAAGGAEYTNSGQCLTDTFSVTNPGGPSPPTICGTNTGEHMYVDADKCCNDLNFNFLREGKGNTIPNRSFQIKITQYSCDYNNLAPPGCTQYFFGSNTGTVKTYNFDGNDNKHLANQKQNICIRREIDQCRICWVATGATDFSTNTAASLDPLVCCGYGSSGSNADGFDCAVIPGAEYSMTGKENENSRFCGSSSKLSTSAGMATICSTQTPFRVSFISDSVETAAEVAIGIVNVGFCLSYVMDNTNCIAISDVVP